MTGSAAGTSRDPQAADGGHHRLRPLRNGPDSVPITRELYQLTTNPYVLAFQASVGFHVTGDPPLTLAQLAATWGASRRVAAAARRELVELGYWAEVRARLPHGHIETETRHAHTRYTDRDIEELAAEYAPSSQITVGGQTYRVAADGRPVPHRHTRSGHSAPPADLSTGLPRAATRSDRATGPTGIPKLVTRSDQVRRPPNPGRTEGPEPVALHASVRRTDEKEQTMHDQFWMVITTSIAAVDAGGQRAVHREIDVAFTRGWTPHTLADWIKAQIESARAAIANKAGFVVARLRAIPPPPPRPTSKPTPAANTCDRVRADGDDPCDARTRLRTRPDGTVYRCECNPRTKGARRPEHPSPPDRADPTRMGTGDHRPTPRPVITGCRDADLS
ncbi:hypothetical protein [Alloactinosynnema sp. L-07]|uniref:hypothetical protein n=1 Tax=Alloactinosynnema sp. L-07 TaxID=1653480 RepID=UPI00065EFD8D|nr:hypothetical protein [Alloactinosynnema sp. L-07]CRK57071.1 hypothetical protein [Alloactinosynnema sp. L-07]